MAMQILSWTLFAFSLLSQFAIMALLIVGIANVVAHVMVAGGVALLVSETILVVSLFFFQGDDEVGGETEEADEALTTQKIGGAKVQEGKEGDEEKEEEDRGVRSRQTLKALAPVKDSDGTWRVASDTSRSKQYIGFMLVVFFCNSQVCKIRIFLLPCLFFVLCSLFFALLFSFHFFSFRVAFILHLFSFFFPLTTTPPPPPPPPPPHPSNPPTPFLFL